MLIAPGVRSHVFSTLKIGSLAAKTMGVAEEIGFNVEKTWLRTPGAINMALVLYPFPCDLLMTSNQRHVNRTRSA
jgi:hypothetical protein